MCSRVQDQKGVSGMGRRIAFCLRNSSNREMNICNDLCCKVRVGGSNVIALTGWGRGGVFGIDYTRVDYPCGHIW